MAKRLQMRERGRHLGVLIAAGVAVAFALAAPSDAQLIDPAVTTTTAPPPTTTAPPATTTTTTAPTGGGEPADPADPADPAPTTTAPPAGDGGSPSDPPLDAGDGSTPVPDGADQPAEDGEGTAPAGPAPRVVPADAQRIINAVVRTPANSSQALHAAVQQLVDLGLSEEEAIRIGFGRFPVAGIANYSHDWLYPRYGPGFRFHLGTDVFAKYGTPLRAPVDGTVTAKTSTLGGLSVKVHMPDGTYFYYAHLSALPEGFVDGMAVSTGDIVGFVGDSGNAKGGSPHLHIGIYPQGGSAVDPKPILDQMLADALATLPEVVAQVQAAQAGPASPVPAAVTPVEPDPLLATALLRPVLDDRAAGGVDTAVLFEAVGDPSAGGLAVVASEAGRLAASIDWEAWAARTEQGLELVQETAELFRLALAPLVRH